MVVIPPNLRITRYGCLHWEFESPIYDLVLLSMISFYNYFFKNYVISSLKSGTNHVGEKIPSFTIKHSN